MGDDLAWGDDLFRDTGHRVGLMSDVMRSCCTLGLSGKCELFSAKWKFKMQKNTPKFFQKMQNITQNAGKIRSVAMATKMATVFWTGKLVFLWLPVYRRSQTQRLSSEVPLMLRLSSFPRYVCLSPLSILASLAEKYQFRLNYAKSFLKMTQNSAKNDLKCKKIAKCKKTPKTQK